MRAEKKPWDADCDATKAGLERFMRALIVVGGHFTDSFSLAAVDKPTRGVSVFFRVWIPDGSEQRFAELAHVEPLKPPPRVSLGWSVDVPRETEE